MIYIMKNYFLGEFYYHGDNQCYKNYTHKTNIKKFKFAEKNNEIPESSDDHDKTDNNEILNNAQNYAPKNRSLENNNQEIDTNLEIPVLNLDNCIICGELKHNNISKLCVMGKERAKKIFDASKILKDDFYLKTFAINDPEKFSNLNLKYHKTCLRAYQHSYKRLINEDVNEYVNQSLKLKNNIFTVIKTLEPRLESGEIFSLSDVSKLLKDEYGSDFSIKNAKIKSCLIEYYGDTIAFVYTKNKNRSQLFHGSKNITKAINDSYNKDSVSDCADILKQSLKDVKYDLQDKFCDENDLKHSWKNINIPEPFLLFFSRLFDIDKDDLSNNRIDFDFTDSSFKISNEVKLLRIKSLFQVMYHIRYKGTKKTPLHTLIGLFVYNVTKSKNTIMVLNRLGFSISYDDILRIRTRLAMYAKINSQNSIPLPSHFNPESYVTAAFDNFDHNEATLSGLGGTHDTVAVIFQDYDANFVRNKANVSSVISDTMRFRSFTTKLKCQELQNFQGLSKIINLPSNYSINDINNIKLIPEIYETDLQKNNFVWFLLRMAISEEERKFSTQNINQSIPSWSSFNSAVSIDDRPKQIVGYLPVLPFPVTDASTVYTCLKNFNDLLSQLQQNYLAVACDEGVYKIARHIIFENEREFDNIILFLGDFHIIKILLSCIGKYLKHSGIESIFIETELFGVCVTDQVLSGTNYARSVKGFNFLAEALRRLQIMEFLQKKE